MERLWKAAFAVGGVAATGAFVFWSLYKQWLALPIFERLSQQQTFIVMLVFLALTFFALIAAFVLHARGKSEMDAANIEKSTVKQKYYEALLAIKQMPGKLQEAADTGAKYFCFEDARTKIGTLYSSAKAGYRIDITNKLDEFQEHYNKWVGLINLAINGSASIKDINEGHNHLVDWFEQNVGNLCTTP